MAEMRMHANRTFRPRTLSSGERRGLPTYFAFTHGSRPGWWRDDRIADDGEVLGVFENYLNSSNEALVITNDKLIVLEDTGDRSLLYDEIESFDRLCKDPIDEILVVHLRSGGVFHVPVRGRTGSIATVMHFLICANGEFRQRRRRQKKV